MSNNYVAWYSAQVICSVSVMEKLSMTGSTKITDDPMITGKKVLQQFFPTIRRSHQKDSGNFFSKLPLIQRSLFGFFAELYQWSDDHISVFLPIATDDPKITIRFFAKHYRWSDDHKSVFTHDPTTITDDPTTITYRRSDDHHNDWFADDPTIIFTRFTLPMIRRS